MGLTVSKSRGEIMLRVKAAHKKKDGVRIQLGDQPEHF